jgi:hypothetical protein
LRRNISVAASTIACRFLSERFEPSGLGDSLAAFTLAANPMLLAKFRFD